MSLPIKIEVTKELVFSLFLPPLIFEAAFLLRWDALRKDLKIVLELPKNLPMRREVASVTFAVAAFSTVVQGMTMGPAMRRLLPQA